MVHLSRITTRGGDDGTTGLGDGSRVAKTHLRIEAMGAVDELNAAIGLALAESESPEVVDRMLRQVQNDLFDLGADLCTPGSDERTAADSTPDCNAPFSTYVRRLENEIERLNSDLRPLDSFVLPGGSRYAAALHLARTVCRRAERDVLRLGEVEPVSAPLRQYLNRLSDLLFVAARVANDQGRNDVLWRPGQEPGAVDSCLSRSRQAPVVAPALDDR
jgi:cob(I)alamin adenosyltransferase